jgi:hypothetical protein
MATINTWNMTQENMEDTADMVKAIVAEAMVGDGLLPAEVADAWCASHTVIMRKKSIFRTISDLWKKAEESQKGMMLMVVKEGK